MYLEHFNLQQFPFRNTPDPRFFLETPHHEEALANLVYAVTQRRGFVLLSGEIGSGKTLVTHLLLQHLEDQAQIALIRNTHLNSVQLIRLICDEFSVRVHEHADKAAMLLALNQFLIQQLSEDRLVVVIIDEAQNLSDKVMEELRMLSNLETSSDKLLQIVLVGQPELREKVSQPHLEQLRQRIALSYHLEPLNLEQVTRYIEHRLKVAGPEHKASFSPEAVARIVRFSRGTPRIINGLCDNALLYAFTSGKHAIDEAIIERVLKQSMHLAPRSPTPTRSPLSRFTPAPRATRVRPNAPEVPTFSEPPRQDPPEDHEKMGNGESIAGTLEIPGLARLEEPEASSGNGEALSAMAPLNGIDRSADSGAFPPQDGVEKKVLGAGATESVMRKGEMATEAGTPAAEKLIEPPQIIPFPGLQNSRTETRTGEGTAKTAQQS
jgi:general secretion pathway protein A